MATTTQSKLATTPASPAVGIESSVTEVLAAVDADPELRALCMSRDLYPAVRVAVDLVLCTFSPITELYPELEVDPDTDERRVVLNVAVDGSIEVVNRQYYAYTRGWVNALPPATRDLIRLFCRPLREL